MRESVADTLEWFSHGRLSMSERDLNDIAVLCWAGLAAAVMPVLS